MLLLIDATLRFPLNSHGQPLLVAELPPGVQVRTTVQATPEVTAVQLVDARVEDIADVLGGTGGIGGAGGGGGIGGIGTARSHVDDPLVSRAVGLLKARERYAFDPSDGSALTWDETGAVARGASGRPVFPRIDPCVIGVVEHADGQRVLLGENRRRPGYFTCIAGYMDVGESAEAAFAREVLEETGRRIADITYVGSQPWSLSGSLMLGFHARTGDDNAVGETDGELSRILWARRKDLGQLQLAPEGSIARQLIDRWAAGEL